MNIAVEVKELTKRYGELMAVNKVSFTIEEGEISGSWDRTEPGRPPLSR